MARTKTSARRAVPEENVTYSTSGRVKVIRRNVPVTQVLKTPRKTQKLKTPRPEKPLRICYDSNGNETTTYGYRCGPGTRSRKPGGKSGKTRAAIYTAPGSKRKCYDKKSGKKSYTTRARCPPGSTSRMSKKKRKMFKAARKLLAL